ncbi:MAG: ChaN family lipoprotein [Nitrospirota bacterium]
MKLKILLFLIVFFACSYTGTNADQMAVYRASDGKIITFDRMVSDLKEAEIVLVGETHDRERHHRIQLQIIKALRASNKRLAVAFEMLVEEEQQFLDQWVSGSLSLDEFLPIYYRNWNFPWPLYKDIFLYIRDHKIPALALNVAPEITRKVARSGFASLTEDELKKLPPETGCVVNEQYMQFIRRAYAMHGHGGKQFLYFCEAQLLWDQVMAKNLVAYLKKNPGSSIVTIAGNGHAWKRGIPEHIRAMSEKTSYRVVLPEVPGYIDPRHTTSDDADYIILHR